MLRHLKVKNFVFFEDEYNINFEKGSNFFIGPNNSGKSSIFEAVRRCMSTSKNTSLSRPFHPEQPSTVVAFFNDNQSAGTIVSSIIRLPELIEDEEVPVYVKIVYRNHGVLEMDFVREAQKTLVHQSIDLPKKQREMIYEKVCTVNEHDFKIDQFTEEILRHVGDLRKDFAEADRSSLSGNNTTCEKILKECVDPYAIFMFPVRGIGVLQWSLSEKVNKSARHVNDEEVQQRAEIVTWFFTHASDAEKKLEEKYYNIITNHSEIKFVWEDSKVIVRNASHGKRKHAANSTEAIPLVKVPDGLLEAKNCSIILSMEKAKTIGIEEPEKGMNPQMIERLTELILRKIENKTVILTSHHPAILAPWNIPRIFFFRRIHKEKKLTFKIISGAIVEKKLDGEKINRKTPRLLTSDHFASIFFAKRALLLEGESDFLFVTTLKTILLENEEKTKRLLELKDGCIDPNTEQFGIFLCSLHIVKLNGHENKLRLANLCKNLNIEHILVLDHDAIIKVDEDVDAPTSVQNTFLKEFSLSDKYIANRVKTNVEMLEEEEIFVWKKFEDGQGTIEDVVRRACKKDPTSARQTVFDEHNAKVPNVDKKAKARDKLFGAKEVTSADIEAVVEMILEYESTDYQDYSKEGNKEQEKRKCQVLRFVWFLYKRALEHIKHEDSPNRADVLASTSTAL